MREAGWHGVPPGPSRRFAVRWLHRYEMIRRCDAFKHTRRRLFQHSNYPWIVVDDCIHVVDGEMVGIRRILLSFITRKESPADDVVRRSTVHISNLPATLLRSQTPGAASVPSKSPIVSAAEALRRVEAQK